jgi:hypothetical protein
MPGSAHRPGTRARSPIRGPQPWWGRSWSESRIARVCKMSVASASDVEPGRSDPRCYRHGEASGGLGAATRGSLEGDFVRSDRQRPDMKPPDMMSSRGAETADTMGASTMDARRQRTSASAQMISASLAPALPVSAAAGCGSRTCTHSNNQRSEPPMLFLARSPAISSSDRPASASTSSVCAPSSGDG